MKVKKFVDCESKTTTRSRMFDLLKNQSKEDRRKKSSTICQKLFEFPEFISARVILCYASFDGEVETFDMMKQALKLGKKVVLPKIMKDQKRIIPSIVKNLNEELEDGPYGIKQPKAERSVRLEDIDVVVVPGVAFDRSNHRLGRGGGYYDRFLAALPARVFTVGLAFDFQILDDLPHLDQHDMRVDRVLVN